MTRITSWPKYVKSVQSVVTKIMNMKKEYTMPQMEVVKIQQTQMLCSSPGARSLVSPEGFILTEGLDGDDN